MMKHDKAMKMIQASPQQVYRYILILRFRKKFKNQIRWKGYDDYLL